MIEADLYYPTDLEGGEEWREWKQQNENIVYGQPFQAH